jgi:hypothetical protein
MTEVLALHRKTHRLTWSEGWNIVGLTDKWSDEGSVLVARDEQSNLQPTTTVSC